MKTTVANTVGAMTATKNTNHALHIAKKTEVLAIGSSAAFTEVRPAMIEMKIAISDPNKTVNVARTLPNEVSGHNAAKVVALKVGRKAGCTVVAHGMVAMANGVPDAAARIASQNLHGKTEDPAKAGDRVVMEIIA